MAGMKVLITLAVILLTATAGGKRVAAEVHHVVGDGRNWEPATDLASWFTGRVFRVGDIIWFTNSAAQEIIVELETLEEFLSCNLTNPIKRYSDGLHSVSLEREGVRYFASGNLESCKKGLRLPVRVQPGSEEPAAAPPSPSASTHLTGLSVTVFVGLVLCFLGL